jgi:DNA polymerase III subunit beta
MKIRVLQEELLRGLTTVSRFVASRPHLPVLSNVLISAEKGVLKLAATNLETGIVYKIGAKIEEEGAITVPVKTIVELVANLSAGPIDLTSEEEQLHLTTQSARVRLSGILANEFPHIPESIESATLEIDPSVFLSIKNQVVFSASTDEARPTLTGILLRFVNEKLQAVATDGFRLSCKEISTNISLDNQSLLIPAKLIDEVCKISGDSKDALQVALVDKTKQIIFSFNNIVLTGRLLEGEFPSFEKIVPQSYSYKFTTDKDALSKAIKVIGVIARESLNIMKLEIQDGVLVLKAENQQYGQEEIKVEAKTEGTGVEIAFNYKFVQDALNSIKGESVLFESDGADKPGVFRDLGDKNYFHLIMPVRVQT